jgi:ABC-type multidrug transport system permease subunit
VPPERLPRLLQWTSYLVSTTYTVQAVRGALVSQLDGGFWLNLAVLAAFYVLGFLLVVRHLDWRA